MIDNLRCEPYPLLEKVNRFLLYREWYDQSDLTDASAMIRDECDGFRTETSVLVATLRHSTILRQIWLELFRECDRSSGTSD